MTRHEFEYKERAILDLACDLYQSIGHDLQAAAGLGTDDAYVEDEEVASVLQDRMRDWLTEHDASLVPVWDAMSDATRHGLCMEAL